MLNWKKNLKSEKKDDKEKGFVRQDKTRNQKTERIEENKLSNLMNWCCSFRETKSKETSHGKKSKNKKAKKAKQGRQEEKKPEREREIQGKREGKREVKQKAREETKGDTDQQKLPFSGENRCFCFQKQKSSPGAPAEARRWIFFDFGEGNLAGNFTGILWDFFWPTKKGSNFAGKFRSIFREKIRAWKKIFRANFVLQTCHPKKKERNKKTNPTK